MFERLLRILYVTVGCLCPEAIKCKRLKVKSMRFHKTIDIRPEKVDTSDMCYPKKVDFTYSLIHTSFYLQ